MRRRVGRKMEREVGKKEKAERKKLLMPVL